MLELLVLAVAAIVVLWLAGQAGAAISDRVVSSLSRAITGWRGDGWPVGVQEEDRDRPWGKLRVGRQHSRHERPEPLLAPTLSRVKPTVRAR